MLIRDHWYIGCASAQLGPDKGPYATQIGGKPIVIFRDREHQAHALLDRCCHRGLPLSRCSQGRPDRVRLPWLGVRQRRQVPADSLAGRQTGAPGLRRSPLPGRRARRVRLDLDGRR
jgi:hypothetical protein